MNNFVKHVAIVDIKAKTPFKIGCGKIDYIVDMPINRDFNNLPFIQGSSIAGLLRKEFDEDTANELFGCEECAEEERHASKIVVSNALLVDENGDVNETLTDKKSEFLQLFEKLPIREHTAINHRGVAKDKSKFDEEIIYRGTKFRFMIEYEGEKEKFEEVLSKLKNPFFRIGGKTTSGYGEFEVEKIEAKSMNAKEYIEFVPTLNVGFETYETPVSIQENYYHFRLKLKPESFYLFGSGYSDKDADITPLFEEYVDYEKGELSKKFVVIPSTSVKGAVSHRTAYYYNLENGFFADEKDLSGYKEEENEAVRELFGSKKDEKSGQKGKVYISEVYVDNFNVKVFDHVKIDRFTGGAVDSALFNEKVIKSGEFEINIYVKKDDNTKRYIKYLKKALEDLKDGMLPLGFGATKGHGIFTGELEEVK